LILRFFSVLILLILPLQAVFPADTQSLEQGRQAMWRSICFSGWGQVYNQDLRKAIFFSAAEASILAAAWSQHKEWRSMRDLADAGLVDLELASERSDFFIRDRNKLLWWWLWAKLACVLDAYVSGSMSNFDTDWPTTASHRPQVNLWLPHTPFQSAPVTVGLQLRFSLGGFSQ
jgi:hypothetical protein